MQKVYLVEKFEIDYDDWFVQMAFASSQLAKEWIEKQEGDKGNYYVNDVDFVDKTVDTSQ